MVGLHRAHFAAEFRIVILLLLDLVARVHDRGVVLLAEFARDLRQRRIGELAREVHRDLARHRQALIAALAFQLL